MQMWLPKSQILGIVKKDFFKTTNLQGKKAGEDDGTDAV